jgi:hypothetical protein
VLQRVQKETGQAFLVADGNASKIVERHQLSLEKPLPKPRVRT